LLELTPTECDLFPAGFPALIRAELLSESDIEALSRFFDSAEAFNPA
jgi:hypothetical protein